MRMARFMNSARWGQRCRRLDLAGEVGRDVGVVIVADPDDAEEVGGVAGEPDVVGGAGLAGCGCGETVGATLAAVRGS